MRIPEVKIGWLSRQVVMELILSYHEYTGIVFPVDSKPLMFINCFKDFIDLTPGGEKGQGVINDPNKTRNDLH